jgi:hypothetical protein
MQTNSWARLVKNVQLGAPSSVGEDQLFYPMSHGYPSKRPRS